MGVPTSDLPLVKNKKGEGDTPVCLFHFFLRTDTNIAATTIATITNTITTIGISGNSFIGVGAGVGVAVGDGVTTGDGVTCGGATGGAANRANIEKCDTYDPADLPEGFSGINTIGITNSIIYRFIGKGGWEVRTGYSYLYPLTFPILYSPKYI